MASQGSNNFSYQKASVVKVYKAVWTPYVGQILQVKAEEDNDQELW
jgi:hypothetical protein